MPKISAGLLMYRVKDGGVQVLLVHPGGPFWAKKDAGAWSIPKGEVKEGEDEFETAKREFREETSVEPQEPFQPLTPVKQKSGKIVKAWAFKGDLDPKAIKSNTFKMEWPPKSGKQAEFPEIDKAEFFTIEEAGQKINPAQAAFLTEMKNLR